MIITVMGLGFVGLTTALGLSEKGHKVYGYDVNTNKVSLISRRHLPFYEKGLQEILEKHLHNNFIVTNSIQYAIKESDVIFLCVGTPADEEGKADLKYIKSAIDEILINTEKSDKKVIVIKSTIPPSTTSKELIPYIKNQRFGVDKDIFVANNPEFLREGHAWDDFINPDRIVIGTENEYTKDKLGEVYADFNVPIHFVTLNTGEFIKYLSNTFLATLISYSNEMSMIADYIGNIDIKSAFKIFHEDKRWYGNPANMQSYAYPGCGFGGYCLPKDTQALVKKSEENGYNSKILKSVLKVNNEIKPHWIDKIRQDVSFDSSIAILGLSFKPESDDVRQTPALEIINLLLQAGYNDITCYDPIANDVFNKLYDLPIKYAYNLKDALDVADNIIIVTGWKEFSENKRMFEDKNIYDLRYVL